MIRILGILIVAAVFSLIFWVQDSNAQGNNTNTGCGGVKCETECCGICSSCANGNADACDDCMNRC